MVSKIFSLVFRVEFGIFVFQLNLAQTEKDDLKEEYNAKSLCSVIGGKNMSHVKHLKEQLNCITMILAKYT